MREYIFRRLIGLALVLLGVSVITFSVIYVLPGDPARVIAGQRASEESLEGLRVKWGLDKPIVEQYTNYMQRLLRGDMGRSFHMKVEVFPAILDRLPATGMLAGSGLLVALLIGIPAGVISAVRQYDWADHTVMVASLTGISLPAFLQGLLLIYFLAYAVPIFPIGGYGELRHLVLPAVTLGIHSGAWYARILRSIMLDILGEDYIRTAVSKGLRGYLVITRHGLRNALGPIVTMVGADLGYYLGGVLVVEKVFGWPGIGMFAWTSIAYRDMPVIMATVLAGAFFLVLANLLVDAIQVFIDPRTRLGDNELT